MSLTGFVIWNLLNLSEPVSLWVQWHNKDHRLLTDPSKSTIQVWWGILYLLCLLYTILWGLRTGPHLKQIDPRSKSRWLIIVALPTFLPVVLPLRFEVTVPHHHEYLHTTPSMSFTACSHCWHSLAALYHPRH